MLHDRNGRRREPGQALRIRPRGGQHFLVGAGWRNIRLARSQRRGQNHHHPDADRPYPPLLRHGPIAGHDVVTDLAQIKPIINLVFEEPNLYERLTGWDNLAMFARLYDAPLARVPDLLEL